MSRKPIRRKCRCCRKFFTADAFNNYHQVFCSTSDCQRASKAASQRRWVRKLKNPKYFRDEIQRVQDWRKLNPGYWKKKKETSTSGVSHPLVVQPVIPDKSSRNAPQVELSTLRDFALTEHPAFVGLISMVTGSTLRDDIVVTSRQLVIQGQNILGLTAPEQQQTLTN